jgi:hypothetical protein
MRRISIVYEDDAFGRTLLDMAQATLLSLSLDVFSKAKLPVQTNDMGTSELSGIEEAVQQLCESTEKRASEISDVVLLLVRAHYSASMLDFVLSCTYQLDFPRESVLFVLGAPLLDMFETPNQKSFMDLLQDNLNGKMDIHQRPILQNPENVIVAHGFPHPADIKVPAVEEYQSVMKSYVATLPEVGAFEPCYASIEGYLLGRMVVSILARMVLRPSNGNSAGDFLNTTYTTGAFFVNTTKIGPFSLPSSEGAGCNQGLRSIWIGPLFHSDQEKGLLGTNLVKSNSSISGSMGFYDKCKFQAMIPRDPILFGHIGTSRFRSAYLLEGILAAIQAANRAGGIQGRELGVVPYISTTGSTAHVKEAFQKVVNTTGQILGFLNNDGQNVTNLAVMWKQLDMGRIFFGPVSGNIKLRIPFISRIINIRSSIDDEAVSLLKYLIETRDYSKISILYDDSSEAYQALVALKAAMYQYSIPIKLFASASSKDPQGLYEQFCNKKDLPELIICLGNAESLGPVVRLISRNSPAIHLAFTSLMLPHEILANSNCQRANASCVFSYPMPHPDREDLAIFREFHNDIKVLNSSQIRNLKVSPSNVSLFAVNTEARLLQIEGYLTTKALIKVMEYMAGDPIVYGPHISDEVMQTSILDTSGLKLGPFSTRPCLTDLESDIISGCECNQGMRSVFLYHFVNENGEIASVPEYHFGEVPFSTCDLKVKQGKLCELHF